MLWGKITGISGISSSLIRYPFSPDLAYNGAFVAGLVLMGFILKVIVMRWDAQFFWAVLDREHPTNNNYFLQEIIPNKFESMENMGVPRLLIAGLLVGFGTKLGNGCTSGHGELCAT
jgi:uncharacterized protein